MSEFCSAKDCVLAPEDHGDLCILHSPRNNKENAPLLAAFQNLEDKGIIRVRDLYLVDANLDGISLRQKNLQHSDLTGASMRNGRFNKVGFDFSVMNRVNFEKAILEKVDLRRTKGLFDIRWHEVIFDGVQLPHMDFVGAKSCYENDDPPDQKKAQFVYRSFKELYKRQGDHDACGLFYESEMDMKRATGDLLERIWLQILWAVCGYGEKPARLVMWFFLIIFGFANGYTACHLEGPDGAVGDDYWTCLYFSIVTFTSLGYGDICPRGVARVLACSEALLGVFAISLFVFVFCRRMVR